MCGLSGLLSATGEVSGALLRRMADAIGHRGPDSRGFFLDRPQGSPLFTVTPPEANGTVGLAHLRLAIIDLSPAGHQPMVTDDGQYVIVYNGEIYNYDILRQDLIAAGDQFTSNSDTEVLLKGLRRYGPAFLERLTGMYAFALYNRESRDMTLGRDAFGIKPLYYTQIGKTFAFASEIKAVLALPGASRRANNERVRRYLAFGDTDNGCDSFFADIHQVPPGSWMTLDLTGRCIASGTHWSVPRSRDLQLTPPEAADHLRSLFLDSITAHCKADVPVAALLSGGIDSSGIVGGLRATRPASSPIDCFTFGSDDPETGEEHWARQMALATQARHHISRPGAVDLTAALDTLIDSQDEPFGSTSIFAQYKVFEAVATGGFKVVLDGQGADELFAGYRPHLAARLSGLLRRGHLRAAVSLAASLTQLPGAAGLVRHLLAGLAPALLRDAFLQKWYKARLRDCGLRPDWVQRTCPDGPILAQGGWKSLSEALIDDLTATNLPGLLRYEDRSSMIWSVESRVPYLTPDLANFAFRIPEQHLIGADGVSKGILRTALRGLVPDAILDRKDKIGFQTPQKQWMQELRPWVDSILLGETGRSLPMLDTLPLASSDNTGPWMIAGARWRALNLIRWTELKSVHFA